MVDKREQSLAERPPQPKSLCRPRSQCVTKVKVPALWASPRLYPSVCPCSRPIRVHHRSLGILFDEGLSPGLQDEIIPGAWPAVFHPESQWGWQRGSRGRQFSEFSWQRLLPSVQQYADRIRSIWVRHGKVRKAVSIQIRRGNAITVEGIRLVVGGCSKRTVSLPRQERNNIP